MDASFQNKVNLLAGLLVAFSLLAVPVFIQVKADTLESAKDAPDTVLSRMSRDFAKQFQPDDLSELEVEDAWYEQAKEENPECGAECEPQGDPDGDGVSNEDELRNGTNPMCNEDEYGEEFCQGVDDKFNVTKPDDPNATEGYSQVLYECVWNGAGVAEECQAFNTTRLRYDYFVLFWNASWDGFGYEFEITNEDGDLIYSRGAPNDGTGPLGGGGESDVVERINGPHDGEFTVHYGYPPGTVTSPLSSANADVMIVGVIEPKQRS